MIQGTLFRYSDSSHGGLEANFFSTKTLIFMLSNVVDCSLIHQAVPEKKGDIKQ